MILILFADESAQGSEADGAKVPAESEIGETGPSRSGEAGGLGIGRRRTNDADPENGATMTTEDGGNINVSRRVGWVVFDD